MKNKKLGKILAGVTSLALVAAISVGATLAYMQHKDTKTNTFTVGNVKIALEETKWNESGSALAGTMYSGLKVDKDPSVKNIGKNPCYVRIPAPVVPSDFDLFYEYTDGDGKLVKKAYNEDAWTLEGGYYYYKDILDAETGETPVLFNKLQLKTGYNANTESSVDLVEKTIDITAEAIQSQGFANATAAWANFTVNP